MIPLSEVLTRHDDWVTLDPDTDYRQITVRLWGKGLTQRAIVKGSTIAAATQNRVKTGQFLISKIDARHGAFGLVPAELNGAVVSGDFPSFDVNAEKALPALINWISKTDWFIALCKRASEGSTNRVRLKEDRFLNQKIPLPPINIQRRIVAQLDGVAAHLAERKAAAVAVEDELAAMLHAVFNRLIAGAPYARMDDIAPLVRRLVEIDLESNYPELGIRSFGKGTFHKPSLNGIEVGTKRLFRIEKDDLLFNIIFAWEGAVAVAQPKDHGRVGSHRFLTCVPDPDRVTATFLRYFFLTPEGILKLGEASPGGAGRNRTLGLKALEAIKVPVPSLEKQQWFDRLQRKVAAIRSTHAAAEAEALKLLPSLLDRAFSGDTSQQQQAA